MITGFSCDQNDLAIYHREFASRLPNAILDAHVHIWSKESIRIPKSEYDLHKRYKPWTDFDLFPEFTLEDYKDCAAALFPGRRFSGTFFGLPFPQIDRDRSNRYILDKAKQTATPFYYMPGQYENAYEAEASCDLLKTKGFLGFKPYPDLAVVSEGEVGLYDMLNHSFLEFADKHGLMIMLHIPGKNRLENPKLRTDLIEAIRRYRNAVFIIAHVARSFCYSYVEGVIDFLIGEENVVFDTALINDPMVLEYLMKAVDPSRILFGSDAPLAFVKGKVVCVNNKHYYVSHKPEPWGLGPDNEGAVDLTYYIYEEIRALLYAAKAAHPHREEKCLEDIFYNNSNAFYLRRGFTLGS